MLKLKVYAGGRRNNAHNGLDGDLFGKGAVGDSNVLSRMIIVWWSLSGYAKFQVCISN